MQIFRSRYTPNITGYEVVFNIGEKVKYQLPNGQVLDIIIDSEIMTQTETSDSGYESIFLDDNKRCFAVAKRIIWWEGKV